MINRLLLFLLFSFSSLVNAQEKISLSFQGRPAAELFTKLEALTGCRIFCEQEVADSLFVSLRGNYDSADEVLQEALTGSEWRLSSVNSSVFFITKGQAFITSLPDNYFQSGGTKDSTDYKTQASSLFGMKKEIKATSENRVYEIGDPAVQTIPQKVKLSGIMTDFKTGEPIAGVAVYIKEPMVGVTTDAFGFYSIELPSGRQELEIKGIGMKDTRRQVLLYGDGKLDIELEEQIYALREVTISSEKIARVRGLNLGVEQLKAKDIKNIPMAFGELDILKVVTALPGVKSVGEVSGGFNVRGGATDQNLILFNDGTIYNPTHLFGIFSAINGDVIKDMELYKSSIPVKYGGRLSSVLDINGKEGNKKEFKGSASLGLLTSRVMLEGPLFSEKTSFVVAGRTTYSDWILKKLPEKSGYSNGSAGFYDLNLSVTHTADQYNSFYLNGYFSQDRFKFDEAERYGYRNANASLKWRYLFSQRLTSMFTAGYDHYSYTTRATDNPMEAYTLDFGINQFFGKADFTNYLTDEHTLEFGLNTLFYDLTPGKYLPHGDESLVVPDIIQKERAAETAIYFGDRWEVNPKLSLQAGLRYVMFNAIGPKDYFLYRKGEPIDESTRIDSASAGKSIYKTYHGPEIRLSARYAFSNEFSAKLGFNTLRQHIHKLSNTTVMSPTDTWKLSDANIRPQTGMQIAGGLYRNFDGNAIETSIEAYYKTMNDYLDYKSGARLTMNHHIETDVIRAKGRAYGVELMVKKTQGKLNGWLSYTYSRTQLRQKDGLKEERVNRGEWYAADFDKPHDIKLVANYKFTHRFSFSLNCDYSTGRPITLPVSKYQYAGGEFLFYTDRNSMRIPDYFRMDASFNIEPSHHLTLLTHSSVSIGVYNLTGRKNAYSVYYTSDNGKVKGYKLAIFGMPIPYISYNIKF
ncbi:TonB-dependent receptor [Massilibacteroides sp.]|uniref:TonB-dependent receptor n=1 Tax=Massilibacteroides sp. TaxID=2034766 RepID=UPI0026393966|nr:TonB-dependent receptor [Massilibacteroides sp.]MDD4515268.1 TonB-dependent receptor [Massilibacteroides sp.]